MPDQLFIYLIVLFNTCVQLMLIRSLDFPAGGKRKYYVLAIAIPVFVMAAMRLLVAAGVIQDRVAIQSGAGQVITTAASILLLAGPWLATLAAIFDKRRTGWISRTRSNPKKPE